MLLMKSLVDITYYLHVVVNVLICISFLCIEFEYCYTIYPLTVRYCARDIDYLLMSLGEIIHVRSNCQASKKNVSN